MSYHKAIILMCLLLFFTVNVTSLNSRPATVDDLDSVRHVSGQFFDQSYSLLQTVESVAVFSPEHSPAYYVILNVWQRLTGEDLFVARLLSVYFGTVALALVHRLALLTNNRQIALAATLVMALFAYVHYYAQVARVYSLMLLICAYLLWSYWQIIKSTTVSRSKWLSFFAAAASILYVHYFGVIILAAILIYHLLFVPKDKRWFKVVFHLAAAALTFTAWLPVVVRGFAQNQGKFTDSALSFPEVIAAILVIYSNGLWILPLVAVMILMLHRRRLNAAEIYLLAVTVAILFILFLANEFSPFLVERRMRYSLVAVVPLSCALAIAVCRLPAKRLLFLPLLALWIASSYVFAGSQEFAVYTNGRQLEHHLVPHYQDFIYEAGRLPGHNEPILSFIPGTATMRIPLLRYYRLRLSRWAHLMHMHHNSEGEPVIQSGLSTYSTPDAISDNSQGIWLIHNPTQANLAELQTHFGWFTERFTFCKRFLDEPESVIDYYLKMPIPCELVSEDQPLAVRYDNGAELANLAHDFSSDSLTVYLRWLQTIDRVYSFTLQIFDEQDNKVHQFDKVISGDPIDIAVFDLAGLSAGEYVVKLIVYDRESKASQPGILVEDIQRFERSINALQFSIPQ
ncbi:MAG: glycosyltransferase family 39 protein [Chloroflexi bacterium]|nr:glycosyltransferase family 39 protein [Chloroflexota bacterium]